MKPVCGLVEAYGSKPCDESEEGSLWWNRLSQKHAMATGHVCLGRSHQNCSRHKLKLSSEDERRVLKTDWENETKAGSTLSVCSSTEWKMLSWISCSGPSRQVTSLTSLKPLHSYSNHHLTKAYAAITPCFAILRFKNYILLICSRKFCFIFVHIFSKVLSTINSRMCT